MGHHHQRQGQALQVGHRAHGQRGGDLQGGGRKAEGEDLRQEQPGVLLLQHEDHHRGRRGQGQAEGGGVALQPHHHQDVPGCRGRSIRNARWAAWGGCPEACLELEEPLLELDPVPDPPSRKLIKQSSIYRTVWHRDVCKSSIYRTEWHQRVCKRKVNLNKTNIWLLSKTVHSFLTVYGINMY